MSNMAERTLYQFPQSHFAEKGRWLLDAKGLEYQVQNLYPGLNRILLWPRTGVPTIPALQDNGHWVGDSSRIALYLDRTYPQQPALLSSDPLIRAQQMAMDRLASEIGVLVRQLAMIYLINTPIPPRLYLQDAPLSAPLRRLVVWFFRTAVKRMYRAYPEYQEGARARLALLLDLAEQQVLQRRGDFLFSDQISLADIALCSMLAPMLAPPGSPWATISDAPVAPDMHAASTALAQRPLGQFVSMIYNRHRHSRNNWRGRW